MCAAGSGSHVAIRMIGKDMTTGRITLGTHLLLLPYFVVAHGWWLIRHKLVRRCAPFHRPVAAALTTSVWRADAASCVGGVQILRWFEGPYDLVAEDVYVGRWPLHYPSEFPVSAKVRSCAVGFLRSTTTLICLSRTEQGVVDLTAEWTTRACVTDGRKYVCDDVGGRTRESASRSRSRVRAVLCVAGTCAFRPWIATCLTRCCS